jgi:glucose/arabinose dehydrogenase
MPAGQNFGWPILEGSTCYQRNTCDRMGLQLPIIEYNTYSGGTCVVIGGHVYRGQRYPVLNGVYFYGDFCSTQVWAATRDSAGKWTTTSMGQVGGLLSAFGEDEAGEIYVSDIQGGTIYRLVGAPR